MAIAPRDPNYVPTLLGVSSSDQTTPTLLEVDPSTGRLLVNATLSSGSPDSWSANEDHTSAQTNNELVAAPGAGLSLYITDIIVSNGATAGSIKFLEDTTGTPVQKTGTIYMAVNGGAVINFVTPIKLTENKNFGFTSTTVTTHGITVNGYTAA